MNSPVRAGWVIGLLFALLLPSVVGQLPVFAGVTTFSSRGSGYAVLELPVTASVITARVIEPSVLERPYALVMDGPLSNVKPWFYLRDPERETIDSYSFPIDPGTYHVYLLAAPTDDVAIQLTFDVLAGEADYAMSPRSGAIASLSEPASWVGLQPPPFETPVAISRGDFKTDRSMMLMTLEYEWLFFAGVLAETSIHRVQGDLLEADCAPRPGAGVGTLFEVYYTRAGFFPMGPGDWQLGVDHAVAPPAIDTYHATFGMALDLDPADPFHDLHNSFWTTVWSVLTLPEEVRSVVQSGACTMVPKPPSL